MREKTFTTPLSVEEAKKRIQNIFHVQHDTPFMPIPRYYGKVTELGFTVSNSPDSFFFVAPKVKGSIHPENPTTVRFHASIPAVMIVIFLLFPIIMIPNIVGDTARPLLEKMGISLFAIIVPAFMFYKTVFQPREKYKPCLFRH